MKGNYVETQLNVSDEHAEDIKREYDMLMMYPDIIGGTLMLTDEIPIEIYPPQENERFPSVILYNDQGKPFIHMFNAELHVSEEEVAFTTFHGGWAVVYTIGDEDENPDLPPESDSDDGSSGDGNGDQIQVVGIDEDEEHGTPAQSDGAESWTWVMENGVFKKVRK